MCPRARGRRRRRRHPAFIAVPGPDAPLRARLRLLRPEFLEPRLQSLDLTPRRLTHAVENADNREI
ncbi:MAG: hypothetical protein AAGN82_19460 [Myxococcota bacterium]